MSDPWLSIIGLGEDSLEGMPPASRAALNAAEVVFGGPRHLELAKVGPRGRAWPVPFSVHPVLAERGKRVAILASGDPFWHGAGGSLAAHLTAGEWRAYPAPSTFSRAAAVMGWRIEEVRCLGLHAAPLDRLSPVLEPHGRIICLLRDGAASRSLATWLTDNQCGTAQITVLERLGGPHQKIRHVSAAQFDLTDVQAPVAVAIDLPGNVGLSRASGLADDLFASDGQITKRPIRALTMSALAPRPGEHLWDIGAGSGSVSVEWCLAGGRATAFEQHASRCENIRRNALRFGIDHLLETVGACGYTGRGDAAPPDAVFVGGGAVLPKLETLLKSLKAGTRLVMNSVTLETESLLAQMHSLRGGELLRIELAESAQLGRMRSWQSARPVVQWKVTL